MLLSARKVVDLGVSTSAEETPVLWGEGGVLRKRDAGLYSSETPSTVVSSFADVGTLVRELSRVVSSTCTWFLLVITATCVEIRGARISGLVVKNSFPVIVCTAVGPAVGVAVLDKGLGVGTGG